ncbi:hypothetical protein, partial [Lactobacillus delbrueckii]
AIEKITGSKRFSLPFAKTPSGGSAEGLKSTSFPCLFCEKIDLKLNVDIRGYLFYIPEIASFIRYSFDTF